MGAARNEADTKLIQQARIIYSTSRCSSDNNSDVERNDSRIYCEETKEDESDLTRKKRISRFFRKYFLEGMILIFKELNSKFLKSDIFILSSNRKLNCIGIWPDLW